MRIERELMRGAGPVAVLKLLADRGEMYGYELVQTLSDQSDGVLAMGESTLYPLLYNLEAKHLIEGHWRTMNSGRQRKYYALTPRGHVRLIDETKQWKAVAAAMTKLGVIELPAPMPKGALA